MHEKESRSSVLSGRLGSSVFVRDDHRWRDVLAFVSSCTEGGPALEPSLLGPDRRTAVATFILCSRCQSSCDFCFGLEVDYWDVTPKKGSRASSHESHEMLPSRTQHKGSSDGKSASGPPAQKGFPGILDSATHRELRSKSWIVRSKFQFNGFCRIFPSLLSPFLQLLSKALSGFTWVIASFRQLPTEALSGFSQGNV